MATFLPYASCYGNKPAMQLMGTDRTSFSFLGKPPCLRPRRRSRARPTSELTLLQLTQLIRNLRQVPNQSQAEEPPEGSPSVPTVTDSSGSCRSFRSRCWLCVHERQKSAT